MRLGLWRPHPSESAPRSLAQTHLRQEDLTVLCVAGRGHRILTRLHSRVIVITARECVPRATVP